MAYSELIKSIEKIREYMRDFYVFGFKSREEFTAKSARSYDDERRRIDSWLGEYMSFRQNAKGKNVFLSVDSRAVPHNPFHRAFKSKSFTKNDIVLHFYLLDMLSGQEWLTAGEALDRLYSDYLEEFEAGFSIDESTLRKKLKEYEKLGLLTSQKRGRAWIYHTTKSDLDVSAWREAVEFFSEEDPLGVIGSYILDRYAAGASGPAGEPAGPVPQPRQDVGSPADGPASETSSPADLFRFKHHYMLFALDSEILYQILSAMREQRSVELTTRPRRRAALRTSTCYPVRIMISTQTGRQYLCGYRGDTKRFVFYRLDTIRKVTAKEKDPQAAQYENAFAEYRKHLWGASAGDGETVEHIEMILRVREQESFIIDRLQREKRCGTVTQLDDTHWKFEADVYDVTEMFPWLRSFIGRITSFSCTDQAAETRFLQDLQALASLYGNPAPEAESDQSQRQLQGKSLQSLYMEGGEQDVQ